MTPTHPILWRDELLSALAGEFEKRPHVCSLATVDEQGMPHARSIVCRSIDDNGTLLFVSDGRSEKNKHLRRVPSAEAVFWLPNRRLQFRLAGRVELLRAEDLDDRRRAAWEALSDASRALFAWPPPLIPRRDDQAFVKALEAAVPPPASFEVLLLRPARVESLDLTAHPHLRSVWQIIDSGWQSAVVTP